MDMENLENNSYAVLSREECEDNTLGINLQTLKRQESLLRKQERDHNLLGELESSGTQEVGEKWGCSGCSQLIDEDEDETQYRKNSPQPMQHRLCFLCNIFGEEATRSLFSPKDDVNKMIFHGEQKGERKTSPRHKSQTPNITNLSGQYDTTVSVQDHTSTGIDWDWDMATNWRNLEAEK
jgi:hypothetical protein